MHETLIYGVQGQTQTQTSLVKQDKQQKHCLQYLFFHYLQYTHAFLHTMSLQVSFTFYKLEVSRHP